MKIRNKFTIQELQQLILDGWIVEGNRLHAYRNGITIDPATYREQLQKLKSS